MGEYHRGMTLARDERLALCALLDQTGPQAPTLCEGWTTGDLAAHLVLREHRPDAGAGVMGGPLAGYTRRVQRSPLNTQCKLLLLTHAFEALNCIAVEFRTHFFNQQSRRAIERLGAKQDGILRSHQVAPNGTLRDTVVYSIIASEWPTVKAHLNYQLNEKPRGQV